MQQSNWPRKRIKHRKMNHYRNCRKDSQLNYLKKLHARFIPVQNQIHTFMNLES